MTSVAAKVRRLLVSVGEVLIHERAPYVVTVLVAAIGFFLAQNLEDYRRAGVVEYSYEKTSALGDVIAVKSMEGSASVPVVFLSRVPDYAQAGYVLSLRNISSTHVLKCARFDVLMVPRIGVDRATISGWHTSTSLEHPVRSSRDANSGLPNVKVFDMQPGGEIEIRINASNAVAVSLIPGGCAADEGGTAVPTVKSRSMETVLVRHGMTFVWVGLVLAVGLFAVGRRRRLERAGTE